MYPAPAPVPAFVFFTWARTYPFTGALVISRSHTGDIVPTPMFPPDKILIASLPFVLNTRSFASVVPIKFVPAVVPALPKVSHAVPGEPPFNNCTQAGMLVL